jgi:hypothetical protein
MTNVTLTTTAIKTTVLITWTDAPVVRIIANQDFPEYGVRKGQTVYLVKSDSLNEHYQGEGFWYYILTWKATGWTCRCPGYAGYGRCKHVRQANGHSRNRQHRIREQAAKAKEQRWLSNNFTAFFEALYVWAEMEIQKEQVQVIAANPEVKNLVKVAPKITTTKSDAPLQGRGYTLMNGIPMR